MLLDLPQFITPDEFANLCGMHPNSVRYCCKNGTLPAKKICNKWLIDRDLVFDSLIELERKKLCSN